MGSGSGFDLDELLERELRRHAVARGAPNPLPSAARYHAASLSGGIHVPLISHLLSTLSAKAVVGLAVATVATGGVTAGVVTTGSPNPLVWGQRVVVAVQGCKAQYLPGVSPSASPDVSPSPTPKNVGQCVSAFARQNGQAERSPHSRGKSGQHGRSSGLSSGPPNGLPTSPPRGRPSGLPTAHPTGRPSGLPFGPPGGGPSGH